MKRQNNLFEKIIDYNNIRLAFLKAIRGNRSSPSAINYCRNIDRNLTILREKMITLNCGWGGYQSFLITDPKLRTISTAPFEQRIMHHAIMNILEPIIERPMIHHSYACRKGKGTHAAVLYAFKQCKTKPYFLKLDIRKVIGKTANGLPFLGFLVKDKGIYLLQKSKRRFKDRMMEITALLYQEKISEEKAAERVRSVFAAIALARTNRLRKRINDKKGGAV